MLSSMPKVKTNVSAVGDAECNHGEDDGMGDEILHAAFSSLAILQDMTADTPSDDDSGHLVSDDPYLAMDDDSGHLVSDDPYLASSPIHTKPIDSPRKMDMNNLCSPVSQRKTQ